MLLTSTENYDTSLYRLGNIIISTDVQAVSGFRDFGARVMGAFGGSSDLMDKKVKDVVEAAKKEPGKVTFASSGAGGAPHLAGEIFQQVSGTKMLHIAYKGGGPAALDLMAGHVNIYFGTVLESVGHVKSGKLKGLGVTSASRSPALQELPTIAESGYAGFDTGSWIGMLAPAGTPTSIINKISADLREVLALPDTQKTLITQGATPWPMTPEQFAERIKSDQARYGRIIMENNLSAE
jgi:tripartite-type tricarboxylate transporter receptor subunit TctC